MMLDKKWFDLNNKSRTVFFVIHEEFRRCKIFFLNYDSVSKLYLLPKHLNSDPLT